jgi:hypothetical protein
MGDALLVLASSVIPSSNSAAPPSLPYPDSILSLLEWLVEQSHAGLPQLATLRGISTDTFAHLCDALARALPVARRTALEQVRMHLHTVPEEDSPQRGLHTLPLPMADVRIAVTELLRPPLTPPPLSPHASGLPSAGAAGVGTRHHAQRPTTPPHARGVLGMVTVSPPTALFRSPAVTGLTKTYTANDFRALRQTPSARQNTSRLPSTHVDVRLSISLRFFTDFAPSNL